MSDTKILQAILDGQRAIKEELSEKIDKLEAKVDKGFELTNERLDMIGKSVANLEDDTPTLDEFDGLKDRVASIEKGTVSV